ncbi:MAG: hypothetical protein HQ564_02030 [Candidatus Saganbacteria bacterium]|nr:hypothetical protein [Candidatus Saganbacteria bacterium]
MGIIGNIYGAARFKFVSGTAMFRGERAKIMMLNNDALSLARVVQYALTINPTTKDGVTPRRLPIAAAAMAHIIDRPNIHAKAVPEIAKYLNHPYF